MISYSNPTRLTKTARTLVPALAHLQGYDFARHGGAATTFNSTATNRTRATRVAFTFPPI
jgi:hypothetical protein